MTHGGLAGWLALAVLAVSAAPSPATAQPPETTDAGEANQLYERGTAALLAGRFPEARDLLGESLRLARTPATAFNLVVALLGLEEPLDAARLCEGLLAGAYGAITAERRPEAEAQCERARAETSVIDVGVRGPERPELRVDGEVVPPPPLAGSFRVLVNPGTHVVSAAADGWETETRRLRTTRGGEASLVLTLVEESDDTWWYVGGTAAGVAVVAGIVITVLLLSQDNDNSMSGHLEVR